MSKLTHRQHQRIKNKKAQRHDHQQEARVVCHLGYAVLLDFNGEALLADFRKNLGDIACNDRVLVAISGENAVIEQILPREKSWQKFDGRKSRVVASHLEQMLLMVAVEPEFQENFIERFIFSARAYDLPLALFVNKMDLADDLAALQQRFLPYDDLTIFYGSVENQQGLNPLSAWLAGKQTLLCGQSGVGKSSLIKYLYPDADVWVQTISELSRLGKHTTTNIRLYRNETSALIDTAGVRGLNINDLNLDLLPSIYPEIARQSCRFNDCRHLNEPDCGVLEALSAGEILPLRYQNYLQIRTEITEFQKKN